MVVEGKLSFDYRYSHPQKQRGKSPPRTDDFFDEHFGARTSTKVRKRNTFHSSGQISNNLDWEKDELKVSKRYVAAFSAHFFVNHSSNCWRGRFSECGPFFTKIWENCCNRFFVSSPFFERGVVGKSSKVFCSYCEGLGGRVCLIADPTGLTLLVVVTIKVHVRFGCPCQVLHLLIFP